MDIFSRNELAALLARKPAPGVSLYLPTHPVGEIGQDPLRLRNLLQEAEEKLTASGMRGASARAALAPAAALLDDTLFWMHRSLGLALFAAPGFFRYYRVPLAVPEVVEAGERFHLTPLLPLLTAGGVYYVLALSQREARLIQATRYGARLATPPDLPQGVRAAPSGDIPKRARQFATTGPVGASGPEGATGGASIQFSTDVPKDERKADILRYCQELDRSLREVLHAAQAPLVLAAVGYLHPIYREANTYARLLRAGLTGNPDKVATQELGRQAWALVAPAFRAQEKAALDAYHLAASRGLTLSDVPSAVLAAQEGRIGRLFVAPAAGVWGTVDAGPRAVRLADGPGPGAEDLLDRAALTTLLHGGDVFALQPAEMPDGRPLAAELRY